MSAEVKVLSASTRTNLEVFEAFGQQPILGDMRSKTKWSVFIKNE